MIGLTFVVAVAAIVSVVMLRGRLHRLRDRVSGLETARAYLERRVESLEAALGRERAVGTEGGGRETVPETLSRPAVAVPPPAEPPGRPEPFLATASDAKAGAGTTRPPKLSPVATPVTATSIEPAPAFAKAATDSKGESAPREARDWERFMGVRLFAWLGGLALFLGVAYFVKYSFDRDLVPPALRVTIGLVTGAGLLGLGLRLGQRAYAVTSQTLCATGVVILYAALFAGHTLYRLPWLPQGVAFASMVAVTAMAFVLSVRLSAMVIAILGWVGGFLTPVLLSTGQDQPLALFLYVGLLDLGLLAVVLHRRWDFLALLGAVGTVMMQLAWISKFYSVDRLMVAWTIFAAFNALFVAALAWAKFKVRDSDWLGGGVVVVAVATLAFGGWLLIQGDAAGRPAILFSFALMADLALLAVAIWRGRLSGFHAAAGMVSFGYLALWQARYVDGTLLVWALVFSLIFAVLHTVLPPWLKISWSHKGGVTMAQIYPSLALATMIIPIVRLPETSFALWPTLLLVDLLALGLAGVVGGVWGALAALVLTGVASFFWILRLPMEGGPATVGTLGILAVSAVMFVAVGGWVFARVRERREEGTGSSWDESLANLMPGAAAVMPFGLMAQLVVQTRMPDPTWMTLVALGITVLLLGVTWHRRQTVLPLAGLAATAMLEWVWLLDEGWRTDRPVLGIVLAMLLFAGYALFPHAFTVRLTGVRGAWIAGALAVLPPFYVTYRLVKVHWPNPVMGMVPLLFAMLAVAALVRVRRITPRDSVDYRERLAWFGGVVLFLVTVAVPIQFDRHVLTVAWALEGAALIWWYGRVPYRGLRDLGGALLVLVFFRLCLNPALLDGATRGTRALWNPWWYLFGISLVSMLAAARWVKPTDQWLERLPLRPVLNCLGVITLFALVNLEIADFFTPVGGWVRFEFSAGFAADMTYTIAWALFALGLVGFGIAQRLVSVRWAGLGLLAVALCKLFLHDLSRLDQLYRVGALIGVALIAITASMLYQRFVAREAAPHPPQP
ncbi:MAG: DUF2339 domain-containing protein [Verrucomicrobiales bacterium]|nr:DUF2339 domain-containing protein [Verrucomicrobiales bacterium]